MGLLSGLLTLPVAPLRGVARIAELLRDQAERQYYDPATIRRELEEIDRARAEGALTDAEASTMEDELVARLVDRPHDRGYQEH
ncbi:gas vesicle protein GvpG [Haloactinopolyspora alba]|uniref:Gas vesicle protein GvpG n=1 Tax=Haloactinopolyspora alba TaxID=648780 RepID=A0A2P8D3V5_9ACTN|nr:gas vesicle protein GvpG [Haloactinopolyspora alba]PSK91894.1 gas vesicle protein GvpG [Haloactinopolyspora alba]